MSLVAAILVIWVVVSMPLALAVGALLADRHVQPVTVRPVPRVVRLPA